MAKMNINGLNISYDVIGTGTKNPIITPGGRFSKDTPGAREWIERMQGAEKGLFRRWPLLVPQIVAFAEGTL